jgi:hypothetical protein
LWVYQNKEKATSPKCYSEAITKRIPWVSGGNVTSIVYPKGKNLNIWITHMFEVRYVCVGVISYGALG